MDIFSYIFIYQAYINVHACACVLLYINHFEFSFLLSWLDVVEPCHCLNGGRCMNSTCICKKGYKSEHCENGKKFIQYIDLLDVYAHNMTIINCHLSQAVVWFLYKNIYYNNNYNKHEILFCIYTYRSSFLNKMI